MKRPKRNKNYEDYEDEDKFDFSVGSYQSSETKQGKCQTRQIGFIRKVKEAPREKKR